MDELFPFLKENFPKDKFEDFLELICYIKSPDYSHNRLIWLEGNNLAGKLAFINLLEAILSQEFSEDAFLFIKENIKDNNEALFYIVHNDLKKDNIPIKFNKSGVSVLSNVFQLKDHTIYQIFHTLAYEEDEILKFYQSLYSVISQIMNKYNSWLVFIDENENDISSNNFETKIKIRDKYSLKTIQINYPLIDEFDWDNWEPLGHDFD